LRKTLYTQMLLHEFREALDRCPIAYVPVGLLEWHGDHLPLGTDVLRAEWVCEAVATRLGGIVLPALYTSCPGYSSFEGTVVFKVDTAVAVGLELAQQLEKVGFMAALFLSAHGGPPQMAFLNQVQERFSGRMKLLALQVGEASRRGDHAGPSETSDMLAARPELVRLDLFSYPDNPINRYVLPASELFPAETRPWVWSRDVRAEANSGIGEDSLQRIIEFCDRWLAEQGIATGPVS
jgi:creatinine amidohydrolase